MANNTRLIKEFNEFNANRMGSDNTPMAVHVDNPQLSMDAFDKHMDNIRGSNVRLNGILNVLSSGGGIFNVNKGTTEDGLDLKDLKILRMFINNDINVNIYISFTISENNYHGVIQNFMDVNPVVVSEAFRDPQLMVSKEWVIKISGLLIKTIRQWLIIEGGKYQALKDINCVTEDTGEYVEIKSKTKFEVIRSFDGNKALIDVNGRKCIISGMNFLYFNYWFKKID